MAQDRGILEPDGDGYMSHWKGDELVIDQISGAEGRDTYEKKTPSIKEGLRLDLKIMISKAQNKHVEIVSRIIRESQIESIPLNMEIFGGIDKKGDWHIKYLVYVVGNKMRTSDVNDIESIQGRGLTGKLNMFREVKTMFSKDVYNFFSNVALDLENDERPSEEVCTYISNINISQQ